MNDSICLALGLKDGPVLIQQYEEHHCEVCSEVLESIKSSGIQQV